MTASDPVATLGLAIALILTLSKVGGDLAVRLGQPPVLGELVAGIVLGSIPLAPLASIRSDPYVDIVARLGGLMLLFEIGLSTTVREVMHVGFAAVRVALLGIAGTLLLGGLAAVVTMPAAPMLVQGFMAAALSATSVGVSARVLKDSAASRSLEAHTILAAAVIDDVVALLMLTVVSDNLAHQERTPMPWSITLLVVKAVSFLAGAIFVGLKLSPLLFRLTSRLRTGGALIAAGLSFCFILAWASNVVGLAPIVGAFTAGLILEESHSDRFVARGERSLSERLEPISSWLVPVFFVLLGMRADLRALGHPSTLLLVGALTVAGIAGKLGCALGAPRGADRLAIAFGMMPRGEVSLVFASLGMALRLLDAAQYAAILTVVVLTTLLGPAALRWRVERSGNRPS